MPCSIPGPIPGPGSPPVPCASADPAIKSPAIANPNLVATLTFMVLSSSTLLVLLPLLALCVYLDCSSIGFHPRPSAESTAPWRSELHATHRCLLWPEGHRFPWPALRRAASAVRPAALPQPLPTPAGDGARTLPLKPPLPPARPPVPMPPPAAMSYGSGKLPAPCVAG